jgi:hypothetical protein
VVREDLCTAFHLAPRRRAEVLTAKTGGLRFATTTGYFLATFRVASLHCQVDGAIHQ